MDLDQTPQGLIPMGPKIVPHKQNTKGSVSKQNKKSIDKNETILGIGIGV